MTVHSTDTAQAAGTLAAEMMAIGAAAIAAARALREAPDATKSRALCEAAKAVRARKSEILAANAKDLEAAKAAGMAAAMQDRLALNEARIEAMAKALEDVAGQADPNGRELARWTRPNGLDIARVATPIGVIGIIYESRPNVTADAGAIALKAGNVAILRGGSDSLHSATAIHGAMVLGLKAAGLPEAAIQYVKNKDRAAVGLMLEGLNGAIDLIIPRGGKGLTGRVMREARVPVLAHLEGLCHVYVHEQADLEMARKVALNAKMRRTSICGAAETLLIDRKVLTSHGLPILEDLHKAGCEIRGDEAVRAVFPQAKAATEEDWKTEYLDAIVAVKVVDGLDEAIAHIEHYGSHHTDSILTDDEAAAEKFLGALDSAIVLWNASTQFADGGEFGMGAEIGIGTGKLHARGPVGVEQLTTFKYVVRGTGGIQAMTMHKGGCHCGKIAYEFDGEIGTVLDCDCSYCQKRGGLLHFIPGAAFRLSTPRADLQTYKFNKHVLDHHFCGVCGISPFSEGKNAQGEATVAINVKCVDDLDWRTLDVKFHNGRDR